MLLSCYITLSILESFTTFSVSHDYDMYMTPHHTSSPKSKIYNSNTKICSKQQCKVLKSRYLIIRLIELEILYLRMGVLII